LANEMNRTDIDYGHELNGRQKANLNTAKLSARMATEGAAH